jgi:hypothetical protein
MRRLLTDYNRTFGVSRSRRLNPRLAYWAALALARARAYWFPVMRILLVAEILILAVVGVVVSGIVAMLLAISPADFFAAAAVAAAVLFGILGWLYWQQRPRPSSSDVASRRERPQGAAR